ncbi:MAG: 3-isopropylmalate dehydratase large subunit [Betaproteobacteria bacterium]|nr:3-isopropylmalate dehydratase large subunit [Betaproteobacteria bacterium]MBI2293548.1 3-isopropylmalate dehydratase large subunit [Betaproteobacteria bacterium]MBI3053506.1 3-isopropylmalate dehydratase large subunit [Betaproteobacteria bacterium]
MASAKTMLQKVLDLHTVTQRAEDELLLYVDYNVVHEGPFYAFDGLAREGRKVMRPSQTVGFADHYVPTVGRKLGTAGIADPEARSMVERLQQNAERTGILHFGMADPQQGIMHVVVPELGMAHPGMVIVGSDSHTCTNGAFGALGFGVGASQIKHVLATQTIWFRKPPTLRITVSGDLGRGVSAKDLALAIISRIGVAGGSGYAIEYAGDAVRSLAMESRMTLCNMTIEMGARAGMIAPDEKTRDYLQDRPYAPSGEAWGQALSFWQSLRSDDEARFDAQVDVDGSELQPMVTWGTCQDEASAVSASIPDPRAITDPARRARAEHALVYMGLKPGTPIRDIKIDRVFIGSCTNARLEDLRDAAAVARGKMARIPAIVVPGSMSVKRAAEAEGLHEVFLGAGFEWRDAGCSMCTGSNGDLVPAGERCASTSNRNMEGRQGKGSRTHLVSPAMAAAAAITGRLADARDFIGN